MHTFKRPCCRSPQRVMQNILNGIAAGMLATGSAIAQSTAVHTPPSPAPAPAIRTQGVQPHAPKADHARVREIQWTDLVPADWNPLQDLQASNVGAMRDGDPRANALLKRMREIWDQAPVNDTLNGTLVRIAGYLVPLEESKAGIKEFLLVPYFGACIHSPPPPANQIIHITLKEATPGFRAMDTVWVVGQIKTTRQDSSMGVSGYQMDAKAVTAYMGK